MFNEIATIPALAAIVYTIIDITKTAMGGDAYQKEVDHFIECILPHLHIGRGKVGRLSCKAGSNRTENHRSKYQREQKTANTSKSIVWNQDTGNGNRDQRYK